MSRREAEKAREMAGYSANKERGVVLVEMRSGDTCCDYKACSRHVRRLLRALTD